MDRITSLFEDIKNKGVIMTLETDVNTSMKGIVKNKDVNTLKAEGCIAAADESTLSQAVCRAL